MRMEEKTQGKTREYIKIAIAFLTLRYEPGSMEIRICDVLPVYAYEHYNIPSQPQPGNLEKPYRGLHVSPTSRRITDSDIAALADTKH